MTEKDHTSVAVIEKHELPELVHPLAAQILAQNPDTQTLRELMALQKDWEENEARKAYSRALIDLRRNLPTVIGRDQTVDFKTKQGVRINYTHTSLAAVMDAVTEPLTQHGFSVAWQPRTEQQTVFVTCRLTHAEGHVEEATLSAPVDKSGSKSDAQGVASTITLLSRYSALALLGIATADMAEPQGETPTDSVDSTRNLKMAKAVTDAGIERDAAEKEVGRTVREWTSADLDTLWKWLQAKKRENEKPEEKPSGQLDEVLNGIRMAQSQVEIEIAKTWIAKAGLSSDEMEKAEAAYKAKLETLTAGREPGVEG